MKKKHFTEWMEIAQNKIEMCQFKLPQVLQLIQITEEAGP